MNAIPVEELTVSIFLHSFPREMFRKLKESRFTIKKSYPGIYHISGPISIKTQVVIISRLPKGEYEAFKALAKNASKEDIIKLLMKAEECNDPRIIDYISAVINVTTAVNEKLIEEIKEAGIMNEAVRRVFKKELEEGGVSIDLDDAFERLNRKYYG